MPSGFEVTVQGLAELQRRLDELKQQDADRIVNRALRAGAAVYKAAEEERAPDRPNLPSGTALPPGALKRDVTIRKAKGRKNTYLVGPGKYTSHAAHLVEFGHRLVRGGQNRVGKDGRIRGGKDGRLGEVVGFVPPHSYARRAFEAANSEALSAIVASVRSDIARLDKKRGIPDGG